MKFVPKAIMLDRGYLVIVIFLYSEVFVLHSF